MHNYVRTQTSNDYNRNEKYVLDKIEVISNLLKILLFILFGQYNSYVPCRYDIMYWATIPTTHEITVLPNSIT